VGGQAQVGEFHHLAPICCRLFQNVRKSFVGKELRRSGGGVFNLGNIDKLGKIDIMMVVWYNGMIVYTGRDRTVGE
jgi:hypothetical protein